MNVHARRFPLFDSLRAIAAIAVLCTHAAGPAQAAAEGALARPFATRLGVGVAIFFVISGFLLYRPFLSAHVLGTARPRLGSYALGRFLRIYPAYWVALTVIAAWGYAFGAFSDDWPYLYFLIQNYFDLGLAGIGTAWSLVVEVAFYVFLPLFAIALAHAGGSSPEARLRRAAVAVAGLAVFGLVLRAWLTARGGHVAADEVPATFLDWFGLGMGLAILSVWIETRDERLPRGLQWLDRTPGLAWAVALVTFVGLCLAFDTAQPGYGAGGEWGAHVLYGVVAIALALPVAIGDATRGLLRRVLANRALLFLGLVSYGIFLWHIAVIRQLEDWHLERIELVHPYVLWPVVTLALTTVIATISYFVVERPALGLRRRLLGPAADRPAGEATAEPAPAGPLPVRDPA
jgi:peptidoglycan/LPS O-acetylase OafA/YrhL